MGTPACLSPEAEVHIAVQGQMLRRHMPLLLLRLDEMLQRPSRRRRRLGEDRWGQHARLREKSSRNGSHHDGDPTSKFVPTAVCPPGI